MNYSPGLEAYREDYSRILTHSLELNRAAGGKGQLRQGVAIADKILDKILR